MHIYALIYKIYIWAILQKCQPEHEIFEVLNICHKWYQMKV